METRDLPEPDATTLDADLDGSADAVRAGGDVPTGAQLLEPHRPTVVVEAISGADISRALRFAARHRMGVAVQATGHGRARGLSAGLLIDTRRMCAVTVDPTARRAWVPAGATWQDVIDESAPHGLAPLSGSLPGVGAVSYTLGGGVGLLARRYGFAADHVVRLEVFTPNRGCLQVTAEDEPDLFWALRGGGGSFGVVSGMQIELMPVADLYGGSLMFDLERAPDVLCAWTSWSASVPETMTSAVSVIPFPDVTGVPAPLRGRHVAQLQFSFVGPADEGERLLAPLLGVGPVLRSTLRTLPFSESGAIFDEPDRAAPYRGRSVLLDDLDPADLTDLARRAGETADRCIVGVRHLGGALAREPQVPNAVGHRGASYSVGVLSIVDNDISQRVTDLQEVLLAPFAPQVLGHSLNFAFGPLTPDRVRSAFAPADAQRLGRIRAQHDPRGVLRPNHPIPAPTARSDDE